MLLRPRATFLCEWDARAAGIVATCIGLPVSQASMQCFLTDCTSPSPTLGPSGKV